MSNRPGGRLRMVSRVCALVILWLTSSAVQSADNTYDHLRHGFDLDGAHQYVDCESCHKSGVFQGTPRECQVCHDGSSFFAESGLSADHMPVSEFCESCHITSDWTTLLRVDHAEVIGNCTNCHNGIYADGLPPGHIQTTAECDSCHNDTVWQPAFFDHANITDGCAVCHNGLDARGKSPSHITTTQICEDCHSTDFWEPVITVDHTLVIGSCASCHNGATATGKHPQHIPSGDNCEDCHTTIAWTPAVFDHAGVSPGTCSQCHDGATATGKNQNHIATNAECDDCHMTIAWIPAQFDHAGVAPGTCTQCHDGVTATGQSNGHFMTPGECDTCHMTEFWTPDIFVHASTTYPGDHAQNLDCTDCHLTNAEAVPWPSPALQPDCAGCHENDYRPDPHKKHENPDTGYTVAELRDCTGACHIYSDASLNTINDFRPGPEHTVNQNGF